MLGPTSTVDMSCPDGAHIPIEQRDGGEIGEKWYKEKMAPDGIKYFNPHSSCVLSHCKGTILGCLHNFTFTFSFVVDAAKMQYSVNNHTMKFLLVLHA